MIHEKRSARPHVLPMRVDVTITHHSTVCYALLYLARHSLVGVAAVRTASTAVPWSVAIVQA